MTTTAASAKKAVPKTPQEASVSGSKTTRAMSGVHLARRGPNRRLERPGTTTLGAIPSPPPPLPPLPGPRACGQGRATARGAWSTTTDSCVRRATSPSTPSLPPARLGTPPPPKRARVARAMPRRHDPGLGAPARAQFGWLRAMALPRQRPRRCSTRQLSSGPCCPQR